MMTWNCPLWVKLPFALGRSSMPETSAFDSSLRTNLMRVMQWLTAAMLPFPPTSSRSFAASSEYLPIASSFFAFDSEPAGDRVPDGSGSLI